MSTEKQPDPKIRPIRTEDIVPDYFRRERTPARTAESLAPIEQMYAYHDAA